MSEQHNIQFLNKEDQEWFKQESLNLLAAQLAHGPYPNYPEQKDRVFYKGDLEMAKIALSAIIGPAVAKVSKQINLPSDEMQRTYHERGLQTDHLGRPLHPWVPEMLANPDIGVALGNGFYWSFGENETADPIVIRHDLDEPHALIVRRRDTGRLALAGGFLEGKTPVETAIAEAHEEALVDLTKLKHTVKKVYEGPLADVRVTAHSWPVTHAFRFDLDPKESRRFTEMEWEGGDDAERAYWLPCSSLNSELFGSHRLLVSLAMRTSVQLGE